MYLSLEWRPGFWNSCSTTYDDDNEEEEDDNNDDDDNFCVYMARNCVLFWKQHVLSSTVILVCMTCSCSSYFSALLLSLNENLSHMTNLKEMKPLSCNFEDV